MEPTVHFLYPDGASGVEDWEHEETWSDIWWSDTKVIRNVREPSLTVYLPDPELAQGTGVVLAPGGGWHFLAYQQEGVDVARWLNSQGIAAFVLKYRLVNTGEDYIEEMKRNMSDRQKMTATLDTLKPMLLQDGQEAIRLVRNNADVWGLSSDRIGIMGYSAGGNVALNVAHQHDPTCRPDFIAAIYTAGWDDVPVPEDAAPLIIICTADDEMASVNSTRLYESWRGAGGSAELHIYSKGGHGFCLRKQNLPVDNWLDRLLEWLQSNGLHTP